jgi:putative glycosyltransferase (TIGR04348 family)
VTPAKNGTQLGNRVTALRWARLLEDLGHEVEIGTDYRGQDWSVIFLLHARKSHHAHIEFRRQHPSRPTIVVLTGTDIYQELHFNSENEARESLEWATRVIVLQPLALKKLPPEIVKKTVVILQSFEAPVQCLQTLQDVFEVSVIGHLRAVKDPFLAAQAVRLLPESSNIKISHLGSALSSAMAEQAIQESAQNPRYSWLDDCPREECLQVLQRSQVMVLSSKLEGGANVVSEAIVCGTPILSTYIDGSIGLLGKDYPGFYPIGNQQALALLLLKCEDPQSGFLAELKAHLAAKQWEFEPEHERKALTDLLEKLHD